MGVRVDLEGRAVPGEAEAPEDPAVSEEQEERLVRLDLEGLPDLPDRPDLQDLPALVAAVQTLAVEVGDLGDQVAAERIERRRSTRRVVVSIVGGALLVIIGFAIGLLSAFGRIDDRVDANTHDIAVTQYTQCTGRRDDVIRQNAQIDLGIKQELRRSKPNAQTIRSLNAFKGTVPNCGAKPKP